MYVGSAPGQLVMISFLFMIMIVIATYVANLTALQTIAPGLVINSLLDFKGKKIAVTPIYGPLVTSLYPSLEVTVLATTVSTADAYNLVKVKTISDFISSSHLSPSFSLPEWYI